MWLIIMFFYMILIFNFSCLIFLNFKNHFLLMLISLEFLVLSLFLLMNLYLNYLNFDFIILIYYLGLIVCESVLGLSMIVMIMRIYGNDYLNSFMLMKW
uniref:NADH-ubiquinone oxidoreductase chain 4L n=1 Tax=Aulacus sinensis TaxID=2491146 RepID=A0A3Q8U9V2_9HYME|nr:NADH dehydrogenase subunit 4L [Aulacus sinensis]